MAEFNDTLINTLQNIPSGYLPPTFAGDLRTAADLYSTVEVNALLATKADQIEVDEGFANLSAELALKAPLASPVFSGVPAGPTPATVSNDNSLATTAYVVNKIAATYTAADILAKLLTVDGIGSGLDSEKLGGIAYSSYALLASPTFTGNPTVPNQSVGDNSTRIANTQHVTDKINLAFAVNYTPANTLAQIKTVDGAGSGLDADLWRGLEPSAFVSSGDLSAYALLASPAFTGTPTAPTPAASDNSTRLATTEYVKTSFAPLASPALTGTPTAPTQSNTDSSTRIATTANVDGKIGLIYQVVHTWSALQTYSAGISFGSIVAGTATDLSNHIKLHAASNYGFSVSSGQLNYVSNVAHVFYSGTTEVARISNTGNLTLLTALPISEGGTGAETAAAARTNLGLAAIASSGSGNDITSGTVADARLPTTMSGKTFTGDVVIGNTTSAGVQLNNSGAIEIVRSGGALIDLKNSNEDFDIRLIQNTSNNNLEVQFASGGTLVSNGAAVVLNNGGTWGINISGTAAGATLATKASTLSQNGGNGTAMTFNWSGQGGQPTWLWGGNDGSNMFVWNPSNFSVNNAANLGGVAAGSFLQTSNLGSAYGAIGYNAVGTVALCRSTETTDQGVTIGGDRLRFSNADGSNVSPTLSGSWVAICRVTGGTGAAAVGVFKRFA